MICWFPVIVQPVPIVFSPNLLVDYFFCFSFCALPVIYFFKKLSDCVYWGKRNQLTLIIIKPLRLMLSIPIVNSLLTNVILIVNRYWQMSSLLSTATDKCHPYCQSLVTKPTRFNLPWVWLLLLFISYFSISNHEILFCTSIRNETEIMKMKFHKFL